MAIEIKFTTNVRQGVQAILDGDVNPIIDFDNVRYVFDTGHHARGIIRWTPFNLTTQAVIGDVTYAYSYTSSVTFALAVFGPSSQSYPQRLVTTTFPSFPVPNLTGSVIP